MKFSSSKLYFIIKVEKLISISFSNLKVIFKTTFLRFQLRENKPEIVIFESTPITIVNGSSISIKWKCENTYKVKFNFSKKSFLPNGEMKLMIPDHLNQITIIAFGKKTNNTKTIQLYAININYNHELNIPLLSIDSTSHNLLTRLVSEINIQQNNIELDTKNNFSEVLKTEKFELSYPIQLNTKPINDNMIEAYIKQIKKMVELNRENPFLSEPIPNSPNK